MRDFLFSPLLFDLVVLGLIFTSGMLSVGKRFTGEICSLLNWVGALGLFYIVYSYREGIFGVFFDTRRTMWLFFVGAIFLVVFALLFVLTGMVSRFLQRYVGRTPDRGLGLIYGVVRGVVIVCVVLLFLKAYGGDGDLPAQINASVSAPHLLPLTDWALGLLRITPWGGGQSL